MSTETEPAPGRYQHFKGGLYEVLFCATAEATRERVVVYRAADGSAWTRPVANWNEQVEQDGRRVPRFRKM